MKPIPSQRPGHATCATPECGEEIHLVNRTLGPTWVHTSQSEYCGSPLTAALTRAMPVAAEVGA